MVERTRDSYHANVKLAKISSNGGLFSFCLLVYYFSYNHRNISDPELKEQAIADSKKS